MTGDMDAMAKGSVTFEWKITGCQMDQTEFWLQYRNQNSIYILFV